jgi:malate synthase
VLPDRQSVTMEKPFLSAYSRLLIKTCHKRGAFAMGGMAAFIPSKDVEKNDWVLNKVRADKELEASNGHDGTWVAHPGLADTVMEVFGKALGDRPNQLEVLREQDAPISAAQLLAPCDGERTEAGMRANIRVAVQYIEAWISGNGCVPIYGLMEDAATAEISRTSIWQWIHHEKSLSDGRPVTKALFRQMLQEEMLVVREEVGEARFNAGRFEEAARLMERITTQDELIDFLTLPGYELLA